MAHPSSKFWTTGLTILAIVGLVTGMLVPLTRQATAQAATPASGTTPPEIRGPYVSQPIEAYVFRGDLRDLAREKASGGGDLPAPRVVPSGKPEAAPGTTPWLDPVAQLTPGQGQMPAPIHSYEGLHISDGGGWHPPDTNGDVGPTYYIQTVNIAIGIYDKSTGAELVNLPYNTFFQGPPGNPCDTQNRGDPVVLYDAQADRWVVTDFSLPSGGPYYECIAVSITGDPVAGGWYFYGFQIENPYGSWNDYPKLSVWPDAYYMSANMFDPWSGAQVWALDRAAMLAGLPFVSVSFLAGTQYGSLLPSNLRGSPPPAGSPNYFASIEIPNTLNIWKFHVDWVNPANSTFTGPVSVQVANFQTIDAIPQGGTSQMLDSLGDRLMMQLQYRNINGVEALYVNHTVDSGGGLAGIRWYEVRDPGGTPVLFQQGTYQPDDKYRWMGSIAADGEGNIAVGYSVSSSTMYPAIRYAGQLAGETPGLLTQGEASLIEGSGSQTGSNRWGDYSAMTVDPVDDCTFWYTQEYLTTTSGNWQTRFGSFKFPSCGQPKGTVSGYVYNSVTNQPVARAPLSVVTTGFHYNTITDASGHYSINLEEGSYDMTAGPLLPGYPGTDVAEGVSVTIGQPTTQDFYLDPTPSLVHADTLINDSVTFGNGNGFPEPGEHGLELFEGLYNQGAITSTQVTARLTSLTSGVTVDTAEAAYSDIPAAITETNTSPYIFSIDPSVPCGTDLNFDAVVTDSVHTYYTAFTLNASVPMPRQDFFFNDVEGGAAGWTTGGSPNSWAITIEDSHSPIHSWTDSPGGNYGNNANNWVRTPTMDLRGLRHVQVSAWLKYSLEANYDYITIEYSTNGGSTWQPLAGYTGVSDWTQVTLDASALDEQQYAALRFHMTSDVGVVDNGAWVDDISLSYEPFECTYTPGGPGAPSLVSPADGSTVSNPVTFEWQAGVGETPPGGYIFYLDTSPVLTFTAPITSTTLDTTLGPHTWFVVATNPFGTSDPSATWNFTTILLPPANFNKLAPVNGSDLQPVNPTLSWESSDGATSYEYCIDTTPGDTCDTAWTSTGSETSVMLEGLGNSTTYYWQVRAVNDAGSTLANGGTWWSFTTIVSLPGAFSKVDPTDGTTGVATNPTLGWETSSDAASYEYCMDTTAGSTCDGLWTSTGTSTSVSLSGLSNDTTYYWQVRAVNDAGTTSANGGGWWSFITVTGKPADFSKVAPADGAADVAASPTLSWETSSGAESYEYCIDTTPGSTCDGSWVSADSNTSVALSGLTGGITYYWQVRALNAGGDTYADDNTWWSFIVVQLPAAFSKLVPANGMVRGSANPTLSWESSAGAVSYEYCVDQSNDELCDGTWTSTGTSTSVVISGLTPGAQYYWQVRAVNPGGSTYADEGTWWSFRVAYLIALPIITR